MPLSRKRIERPAAAAERRRNAQARDGGENIGPEQRGVPGDRRAPVMADDDRLLFAERRDQRDHVADSVEDAVGVDVGGRAGSAESRACPARRHGNRPPQSPGFDAARNRTIPASHGTAAPADLRPVRAGRSRCRWRKWCVRMASLFRLVSEILLRNRSAGTIGSFDQRRNRIGSATSGKTRVVCATSNC